MWVGKGRGSEAPSDSLQVCFPAGTSSAWLGQGSGQVQPPLAPGCPPRTWLHWSSPTGAVIQGSGVALSQGHRSTPVPGGGQAVSGCFPAMSPCPTERSGSWAGSTGPESRPSHPAWGFACKPWRGHGNQLSCQPRASVPTQDPVLPAAHGAWVPAEADPSPGNGPLGGDCLGPPGGDAWARGGSEDPPARASEGHWRPHHLSIARGDLAGPAQMEVPPCGK